MSKTIVLAVQRGNVLVYKQFAVSIGGKTRQTIRHFRACLMPIFITATDTKDQIHIDEAAVNGAYLSTCPGQNVSFRNGVLHVLDEVIHASCPLVIGIQDGAAHEGCGLGFSHVQVEALAQVW